MRTLAAAATTAINSGSVAIVQLVHMAFAGGAVALNSSNWDLLWYHNFSRASTARYWSAAGVLTSAAVDVPRLDFDPATLAARGLLVEAAATNLLLQSEDVSAWSNDGTSTASTNVTTAPTGASTMDKIVETVGNTGHYAYEGASVGAGAYTGSVFLKQADRQWATVQIATDAATKRYTVLVDLSTGAVLATRSLGSPVSPGYTVQVCAGGVLRMSVTATNTSGIVYVVAACCNSATPTYTAQEMPQYAGDITKGIYAWGLQLEAGSAPTSYIPTTTTSATRAADVGAVTFKGAYGLGSVSPVVDKPGEVQGIQLELAGGSATNIALALDVADTVQGTPLTIRTAIVETTGFVVVDAPVDWAGTLDTMAIVEDGQQATIRVTAESRAVDLLKGTPQFYTDVDQQAINPTDRAFAYVVDQIGKPVVWPARSYFMQ